MILSRVFYMTNGIRMGLSVMRFLQRNHVIPPISINVTPFLHNLPVTLTMNDNHLDITAERDEDRFRTTYEHDTDIINISTVIKKTNFELVATVEGIPKKGIMLTPEATTIAAQPQSCLLQPTQQCVLRGQIPVQESLLEAYR